MSDDTTRRRISEAVAANLRFHRRAAGLTVSALAERAGLSRRALVEVEAGRANASLSTLAALADALAVDFGTLVAVDAHRPLAVTEASDAPVLWEDDDGSRAVLLATATRSGAELWRWVLAPGGRYEAAADPTGTEVMVGTVQGTLEIGVGAETLTVKVGGGARFASDVPYWFANSAGTRAAFITTFLPVSGPGRRYTRAT
jgi:transcriptional regulator with XRE-family HTH domain